MANSVFDWQRGVKPQSSLLEGDKDSVWTGDAPLTGFLRSLSDSDLFPNIGRSGGGMDPIRGGGLMDYLGSRTPTLQGQFKLMQLLSGQDASPAAARDFSAGAIRGFFGGGENSPYINDPMSALRALQGLVSGSASALNPQQQGVLADLEDRPDDLVSMILSTLRPTASSSAMRGLSKILERQVGNLSALTPSELANQGKSFVQALLDSFIGSQQPQQPQAPAPTYQDPYGRHTGN